MDTTRFIPQPYEDYTPRSKYLNNDEIRPDIVRKIDETIGHLDGKIDRYLPKITTGQNYGVYIGYSGIAYLFLLKHAKTGNKTYLDKATNIIEGAVANLKNKGVSFLEGDAGPLALQVVIENISSGEKKLSESFHRLLALGDKAESVPYELLFGRVGYLYSLLFVKRHLGENIIPPEIFRKHLKIILEAGDKKAKISRARPPLKYEWYDTNYFGAAHGLAGILYILLNLNDHLTDFERDKLIRPTLDWLSVQRFSSGNFLSSEGNNQDRLVQWCHGATGFVHVYALASKIYNKQRYMELALQCGDVIWERGLLSKGYSICHGVAGNAYAFLELFKATKDLKHLHRAACFADWCTYYPRNEGMKPDRPYSLFEGIAGLNYFLTDIKDPFNCSFPGYGL